MSMERMTKKEQLAGRTVNYIGEDDCFDVWSVPKKFMGNAVDRLAAYEDTGVEPEEIARILDAYGRGMTLRTENAQRLEIVKGIQTDRLRELAQADREGRCVVLPATPDQIIYRWRKGDDCPSVSRLDGVQINADGEITYPIWNGYLIPEDFGKTVFLTREEAELRREQDG
ncbi:hypothetical protein HMPREF1545_00030 [Oscillibacter sp. KLE 1728]|nr:hypothetical protein HMPREF1546_02335 [Oscillibacter sp. KLE 1745]ERK65058.1 hypothetical protein HMPREF1545_00030 [Oscillibacter sp. KLE 1728]